MFRAYLSATHRVVEEVQSARNSVGVYTGSS